MPRQLAWFRRPARVGAIAALTALGGACAPNQSVKPGAPVLTEIKIVEGGGATVTTITADTPDCPTTAIGVDAGSSGAITGGMCDPTTVTLCRWAAGNNFCRCNANPAPTPPATGPSCMDGGVVDAGAPADAGHADGAAGDTAPMLGGAWDCSPFSPTAQPLFVFDRLLDTAPLGPGNGATVSDLATVTFTPAPAMPVTLAADYGANGSPGETIFPLLTFRADGPSLLFTGEPALPTSAAVKMTLDGTKVLAKDGKTSFTATGALKDGTFTFSTGAFSASIATPPTEMLPADAGACTPAPTLVTPDQTPVTITFTNLVNPTAVAMHVTVTATPVGGGAAMAVPVDVASADGLNVTLTPKPKMSWPASSVITVTVDPTTADLAGDQLGAAGAPGAATFTTDAM